MKLNLCVVLTFSCFMFGCAGLKNVELGEHDVEICKAGISTIMDRNPVHFNVKEIDDEGIYFSVVENNIEQKWGYKCRVEGNRVVWGAENGRWMTDLKDAAVFYSIKGDTLTVQETFYRGGKGMSSNSIKKSYSLKELSSGDESS